MSKKAENKIYRGIPGMLDFPCDVERLENGNTLITDAGDETGVGSEVFEVDPLGQIVWIFNEGLNFAHSAKRLPNGNTLITDTNNNRIIEVNQDGKIIFDSEEWGGHTGKLSDGSHLHYPNDAHDLENGTILITDRNNNRCIIVGKDGQIVWCYNKQIKHPHNCDLLPNGNILIADSDGNKIIEVNQNKEIVWSYGDGTEEMLSFPRDADRLENGNTLITDSRHHRVIEVTPQGQIVWCYQVDYYASFYEADRLENGNTLISDQHHHQVLEVDQGGNLIWIFRNHRFSGQINEKLKNGFFKRLDSNNCPESWILYNRFAEGGGKTLLPENTESESYAGIENNSSGTLYLMQHVRVSEGDYYQMSAKIKTEDIADGGYAYFQMFFLDCYGGPIANTILAPKGAIFKGTNDWTTDSFGAQVPKNATAVEVRLCLNGRCKAWMKEVMFFK